MQLSLTDIVSNISVSWDDDKERLEFIESLKEQGQLHPVIVRATNIDGKYELVTGAKRLAAITAIGLPTILAEVKDNCSDTDAQITRVHENLHRHNLPWYEQVILVEQLHTIRQMQHGASAGRGRPKKGEVVWGVRDTAEELGLALGPVAEDINLARAVQIDPSLRNIKDKKTAVRLVRLAAKRMEAEVMAGNVDIEVEMNQCYMGDSATILNNFPEFTFDVCITDPPWLKFYDPSLTIDARTLPVFQSLWRVLKSDSFLYVICSIDDMWYYAGNDYYDDKGETRHRYGALEKIGFHCAKTPIFWKKGNALSRRGVRPWEYDRDFETILVCVKGNPVLTRSGKFSAFKEYDAVPPAKLIHANEKPVGLIMEIIQDCTYEKSRIVDPFGGSGVTAEAAIVLKRDFVVCERDYDSYQKIVRRIEKVRERCASTSQPPSPENSKSETSSSSSDNTAS